MVSKDMLFYIETITQLDSIMPLLKYVRDAKRHTFDIVVPRAVSQAISHDKKIFNETAQKLIGDGFSVTRSVDGPVVTKDIQNTRYSVFLSAYISLWQYKNLNVKYRIMFPYASYYLNKPNWTIKQFIEQDFMADALLSHAEGARLTTNVFTATHIVPFLKLMDFKKKQKKTEKPVIFFAPTHNEAEFACRLLESIDDLKKDFTVVMRGHHKQSQEAQGQDPFLELYDKMDEVYEVGSSELTESLGKADVVLSDNSGVIFDSIYCGVPVALFSANTNSFRFNEISTEQHRLVENGDVLWTSDPKHVADIVRKTLSKRMIERQVRLGKTLFPQSRRDPVRQWMDVIDNYINSQISEKDLTKRYWVQSILNDRNAKRELDNIRIEADSLRNVIYEERNPGVITATKRFIKAVYRKICVKTIQKFKYKFRPYYRKFRIKVLKDPIIIYQFVFTEPDSINFGDELTKDIIERLFKKKTEVHNKIDARFDMLGVGSLLHFFNGEVDYKIYVWGSGLIDDQLDSYNKNFIFKACRGKQTLSKVDTKYRKIPLGDPGLLSNLIYKNEVKKTDKIGVIPHLRDENSYFLNDVIKRNPDIFKVISVAQTPEEVADEIKSCRLVLSSSLHGIIVSDSLGVPNAHLMLSDNLSSPNHLRGGEYKFRDYYSGINRKYANFNPRVNDLTNMSAYDELIKNYKPVKDLEKIQKALIKSFPYR